MKVTVNTFEKELKDKIATIPKINKELAGDYLNQVLDHFESESGSSALQGVVMKWRPLAPSTIKQRQRKGYTGKILQRSLLMMNSIQPYSNSELFGLGTNNPYALTHELGAEIKLNARTEAFKRNRYVKGKKKGKFKKGTKAGQGFEFKASTIRIPKRSFISLTATETKFLFDKFIRLFQK